MAYVPAPRAWEDSVARRLPGASGPPLNFTVRGEPCGLGG
jgi:hypothetical protein